MRRYATFAIAAAAIVLVAVIGIRLLPTNGGIGGQPTPTLAPTPSPTLAPTPSPSPSAAPIVSPTPMALAAGTLPAGNYIAHPFGAPNDSFGVTFTLPAGFQAEMPPAGRISGVWSPAGYGGPNGSSLGFLLIPNLESDPCNWTSTPQGDIPTGTTVDELASALVANTHYEATTSVTTVGDVPATRVDVVLPAGLKLADCRDGAFWVVGNNASGAAIYAQAADGRFHFWIMDVGGLRLVVQVHDFPGTSTADQAALLGIVESVRVQP